MTLPTNSLAGVRVLFLGGGDLGTGAALALQGAGMRVAIVELGLPLAVRRRAAFAEAARQGEVTVEGVCCARVGVQELRAPGPSSACIALVVAPIEAALAAFTPRVVVDARMAKRPLPPPLPGSCLRIALGPGHTAGADCDAVIETMRGADLGAVLWHGAAVPDTGQPGDIGGETHGRVLRAPVTGMLHLAVEPGSAVRAGDVVGHVAGSPVRAAIGGMVRGLLADGDPVQAGQKLGDIDPRPVPPALDAISDKARAVGAGVLTAVREGLRRNPAPPA
jgi:xanthine dehydrogenase accessory factor